ncbi:MAG: ATP-binding protein [Candidatus ainarchaeum sp.]|nr:ATP-binding protein [Candidatus ainarchaeum sp.]
MEKQYLEQIVLDQKERLSKLKQGYLRDKLYNIADIINHKINIVVTGHRRSGKSTFLLQWMNKYYNSNFYYLDFSDERLVDFKTTDFQLLYEIFLEHFGEKDIFYFDELQGKKYDWNKFVNRLYSEGKRFFITGSNADLLSKEISTYLTGRHFDIMLFPFSFKEYLGYNNFNKNYKSTTGKVEVIKYFNNYIKQGGFPEVIVYKNIDILDNIYQDVINNDILTRYNIKEEVEFKKMSLFLISNFSREFSYTSLKNNFNLGSTHTAKKYVSYLINSYLLFELPKYDYSLKKQETYAKKIYAIDTGLINKIAFGFSENIGRLYENLVFIELKRRNKNIYFWKDKLDHEVDFMTVEKNKVISLIQVTYDLSNLKTKEREIKGLLSGLDEFKLKSGIIITKDLEKEEKIDGKIIKYIPLWKWLLE